VSEREGKGDAVEEKDAVEEIEDDRVRDGDSFCKTEALEEVEGVKEMVAIVDIDALEDEDDVAVAVAVAVDTENGDVDIVEKKLFVPQPEEE
jgi:hypothetical protein